VVHCAACTAQAKRTRGLRGAARWREGKRGLQAALPVRLAMSTIR
jgi:hypothetical protein